MRRWILSLVLFIVSAAAIIVGWVAWELRTPYYGSSNAETFVEIPRGAALSVIAELLTKAGVLHARIPFLLNVRWSNSARHLQAGEYRFTSPATPEQIVQRLIRGDVFYISITIPEGLTAHETIEHVARTGLGNLNELENALQRTDWIGDLDPGARSLEGYLFPETYRFSHKVTSEETLKAMVDQFKARFAKLKEAHPIRKDWRVSQIVILASIVEKEVKIPQERPLVASVLINRLERGMSLACDPTIIYALKLAGNYDGNIRKADLEIDSPYNTYIHAGFPPGPIANPGEDSLKAVLEPQKTDFLYFVSRNDGTHQFSKDFQSHLNAVAKFQKPLAIHRGRVRVKNDE